MKPIPQINHNQGALRRSDRPRCIQRSLPLTDYCYQTTVDVESSSSAGLQATKTPAFHKLGSEFFRAEIRRDYLAELLLFVLITGIAAWPIISAMVAITRLVRNY
jgi:hypothetical protein